MTKKQKLEKLKQLGQFLQRLNGFADDRFDMSIWHEKKWDNTKNSYCGIVGCAAGWSEVLFKDFQLPKYITEQYSMVETNVDYISKYFGIDFATANKCFGSEAVDTFEGHTRDPVYIGEQIEKLANRLLKGLKR